MAEKVMAAIRDKATIKKETVHFDTLDADMEVHSLTDAEYKEIADKANGSGEHKGDGKVLERLIYEGCDGLREVSKELVHAGKLVSGWEVVNFLSMDDIAKVARVINRLSGRGAESKVKTSAEIEALKNS